MDASRTSTGFQLVNMALLTEGQECTGTGPRPERPDPVELPEGALVTLCLVFRLGRDVDGLTYTETRVRDGTVEAAQETQLGGFRAGGPYEIHLQPERLPMGHAAFGIYEVHGVFTDRHRRPLASAYRRYRITQAPAPGSEAAARPGPEASAV
ncbi:hypothetical protein HYE82_09990 [Streptomyces sp. BR123]|uniref:hypothetical protein n=1 Tax=Streptomyces sp. BR123 TaxID=2749828 RepID=UPI0015C4D540|nr:hypothetical protein [Streptomyces sp. BR123]NXY94716.1 hypothetical protein [Streptomyces sp. BR123]